MFISKLRFTVVQPLRRLGFRRLGFRAESLRDHQRCMACKQKSPPAERPANSRESHPDILKRALGIERKVEGLAVEANILTVADVFKIRFRDSNMRQMQRV